MKLKVLVDPSILIAGSVYVASVEDLGVPLKHRFFDQTMRLIGLFEKYMAKRIGIVTTTVEDEAYSVLERVVKGELERKIYNRAKVFRLLSVTANTCENRLRKILSLLLREPISPVETSKKFIHVTYMCNELEQRARDLPKKATVKAELAPRGLKGMAFGIYRTQDQLLNAQLMNILIRPIEDSDKLILAQAAYFLDLYKQAEGKKISLFIASTDHHFSPFRRGRLESRQVTDEIESRFGIKCDWPDQIAHIIEKQ